MDFSEREIQLAQLAATRDAAPGAGQFVPELLEEGQTYDGPFVQVEGHGGDCTVTMTVTDSNTSWIAATVYNGRPIEGHFTEVNPTSGNLLAYRKRA